MNAVFKALLANTCMAVLAAGCAASESGSIAERKSVPARLSADFETAMNDVAFPEFAGARDFQLYCVTDVTPNGRARHNACLADRALDTADLRKPVDKLMREFRLSPALLDGRVVKTEFYYRIHFARHDDSPRISIYPNWGHSSELHGPRYDAPQRYEPRRYPPGCLFLVGVATTRVDARGRATGEPEVFTRFGPDEATLECIEIIKSRLKEGEYIPAYRDGEAVAAVHAEVWGDPEKLTVDELADTMNDRSVTAIRRMTRALQKADSRALSD